MKALLILVGVLVTANQLFARIGESEEQIEQRYTKSGKIISSADGLPKKLYYKGGIQILVTFVDGRSQSEVYTKTPSDHVEFLTAQDVRQLLTINGNGILWIKLPNEGTGARTIVKWKSPDGTLQAKSDLKYSYLEVWRVITEQRIDKPKPSEGF